MLRDIVSVLLACGVLIQSAPHCHGHPGEPPAGHDLRPHFHTDLAACHEFGRHHHGPGGHHHGDEGDHPPADSIPTLPGESPGDHDDDAVYLAGDPVTVAGGREADTRRGTTGPDLLPVTAEDRAARVGRSLRPRPHPPPHRAAACPLYVRHLALLL